VNPDLLFRDLMGAFGFDCAVIFFILAAQAWLKERREREAQRYSCIREHRCDHRLQCRPTEQDRNRRMRGSASLGLCLMFAACSVFWALLAVEMHRLHAACRMWESMTAIALLWIALAVAVRLRKGGC
jgi:hypothetical protein